MQSKGFSIFFTPYIIDNLSSLFLPRFAAKNILTWQKHSYIKISNDKPT